MSTLVRDVGHYIHRFDPPEPGRGAGMTCLLLHGTGGDEHDLVPLGRLLAPGAGLLAPRGDVLENGRPRFFRRLSEGVFDLDDLRRRTQTMAEWVTIACERYAIDPARLVACGFSNGANIAASVLLTRPGTFAAAILLSPMVPFEPASPPDLAGTPVFIGAGRSDPVVPLAQSERLATLLRGAHAEVTLHLGPGGHGITPGELDAARAWLAARVWSRVGS
ncbi:MAG: alpha/beta hydrolase [Candidatus Eisenbacteria bacterium]